MEKVVSINKGHPGIDQWSILVLGALRLGLNADYDRILESAINALEVHGLDKCPDDGIDAFERYVALAVLSRNIQKLGIIKHDRLQ